MHIYALTEWFVTQMGGGGGFRYVNNVGIWFGVRVLEYLNTHGKVTRVREFRFPTAVYRNSVL
jgi:hypothetical protein